MLKFITLFNVVRGNQLEFFVIDVLGLLFLIWFVSMMATQLAGKTNPVRPCGHQLDFGVSKLFLSYVSFSTNTLNVACISYPLWTLPIADIDLHYVNSGTNSLIHFLSP